ncbi:KxDL motif-containing protein 1 [Pelomyxa schiedti]|nr:KxDL motif-containing protein 1 [Pelomyxa schiedti]
MADGAPDEVAESESRDAQEVSTTSTTTESAPPQTPTEITEETKHPEPETTAPDQQPSPTPSAPSTSSQPPPETDAATSETPPQTTIPTTPSPNNTEDTSSSSSSSAAATTTAPSADPTDSRNATAEPPVPSGSPHISAKTIAAADEAADAAVIDAALEAVDIEDAVEAVDQTLLMSQPRGTSSIPDPESASSQAAQLVPKEKVATTNEEQQETWVQASVIDIDVRATAAPPAEQLLAKSDVIASCTAANKSPETGTGVSGVQQDTHQAEKHLEPTVTPVKPEPQPDTSQQPKQAAVDTPTISQIQVDHPASRQVSACVVKMIAGEPLDPLINTQKDIIAKAHKTTETINKFNEECAAKFAELGPAIEKHTKMVNNMKKDLEVVFKRIRAIRVAMQQQQIKTQKT